jgi:perosamine synthetase
VAADRLANQKPGIAEMDAIPLFRVSMPPSVMTPLRETLMSGFIGEGPRVAAFENALRPWFGSDNVLALNSGTSALHLALRLAGIAPGDEVISTPLTCVATNISIVNLGARIVWADIDPGTGNIDPAAIAAKVTPRTRAIVVVHLGGMPCDLAAIQSIADEHGLRVIEDAGHALGARYQGRPIGCHSDFVCFSFQAVKTLTTGDGGALTCRDPSDRERGRLLRWYGLDRQQRLARGIDDDSIDIVEAGEKLHMNDICATIGLEQLNYLADSLARMRSNARRYDEAFRELKTVATPTRLAGHESSNWLYAVRVPDLAAFRDSMARAGVMTSRVHLRNDTYSIFRDFAADLPGVDAFSSQAVCIPVGWWLGEVELQRVIGAVHGFDAQTRGRVAVG